MQKKNEAAREALYGELGKALDFTREDLEANRAGFVSHRQLRRAQLEAFSFSLFLFLFGSFLLFLGFGTVLKVFLEYLKNPLALIIMLTVLILLGLVFAALMSFSRSYYKNALEKVRNRRVDKRFVQKSHEKFAVEANSGSLLRVPDDVYKIIEHGQLYCIYFFEDHISTRRIYSIEAIYEESLESETGHDFASSEREWGINDAKEKRTVQ